MSCVQFGVSQISSQQLAYLLIKKQQTGGGGFINGPSYQQQQKRYEREQAELELARNKELLALKRSEATRRDKKLQEQRRRDIQEAALAQSLLELEREMLLLEQQNILLAAQIAFLIQEEDELYILMCCISG